MIYYDQNGNRVTRSVRNVGLSEPRWIVDVWSGGHGSICTNIRTYTYRTRQQARDGDIGDSVGQNGRIA